MQYLFPRVVFCLVRRQTMHHGKLTGKVRPDVDFCTFLPCGAGSRSEHVLREQLARQERVNPQARSVARKSRRPWPLRRLEKCRAEGQAAPECGQTDHPPGHGPAPLQIRQA